MSAAPVARPEIAAALQAARELRAGLGIADAEAIGCVLELAEARLGLDVVIAPLGDGVSGFYVPGGERPVVALAADHPVARQRFTLAHEIAHHVLGHGAAPRVHAAPAAAAHYEIQRQAKAEERAANAFAGELLAPDAGARTVLAPHDGAPPLDLAVHLSARFGLSDFAALVKLQLLGVVDAGGFAAVRAQLIDGAHAARFTQLGCRPLDDALQRHADAGAAVRCSPGARVLIARLRAEADAALAHA